MPRLRLATGAILAALLASCSRPGDFVLLTAGSPAAEGPEGLTLSVVPAQLTSDLKVYLDWVQANAFRDFHGETVNGGVEWTTARQALPNYLQAVSPVYTFDASGWVPAQMTITIDLPEGVDGLDGLDVYAWQDERWQFVPAHVSADKVVIHLAELPDGLGLFRAGALPPLVATRLESGHVFDGSDLSVLTVTYPSGLQPQADGSLTGGLVGGWSQNAGYAVMPIVSNLSEGQVDAAVLTALLGDAAVQAAHVQALVSFTVADSYPGLVIAYSGVNVNQRTAFSRFISALADALHAQHKVLGVAVDPALPFGDAFATGGYDWQAIGAAADFVELPIATHPSAYGDGQAENLLSWAVGEVSRYKLRLLVSALSVEAGQDGVAPIDYQAALDLFGDPALAEGAAAAVPGQAIQFVLSGPIQSFEYDSSAIGPRFSLIDEGGLTTDVWLTTPDSLLGRMRLAGAYQLGGVTVEGLFDPQAAPDALQAISLFKANATPSASNEAALLWTVSAAGSAVARATGVPGQPFEYVAEAPGDYRVDAEFVLGDSVPLGSISVSVGEAVSLTPTPVPGTFSGGAAVPTLAPPVVAPLPKATGPFELGGQVLNGLPVGPMQMAGMHWVKTQARGSDMSGFIASAHGSGLKVLLTVLLDRARVTDPAYWSEVAAYAAAQAASGADAIEVWNEMNIDAEWPTGQINPATYVEMLKVVYPAIKAANGSTLVISGAPAPTGAEGVNPAAIMNDDRYLAGMYSAGAATVLDCIGIHFNSGTTAPAATSGSALSGYHYSYYFWPMIELYYNTFAGSRPLCFTELGYLTGEGYGPLPSHFSWASGVSVAHQAAWLAEAASLAASSGKVRLMIVWNMDSTYYGSDPQAGYAIIRPGGGCPACTALGGVMG